MNDKRPLTMPIPSRDSITAGQIDTLLRVAGTMNNLLFNIDRGDEDGDTPSVSATDGGVRCSLEATLMGVCSRLDEIVSDKTRWSMKSQDVLTKKLLQVYDANLRYLAMQADAIRAMSAPHRRCPPTLLRLDDGRWAAFQGDLKSPGQSIVGIGLCPEDALKDFDNVFRGKSENATVIPTDEVSPNPNETQLDPSTTKPTDNAPQGGQDECPGGQNNGPE